MRYLLIILTMICGNNLFAQMPNIDRFISAFDKALINKDTVQINALLSSNITYGHSNGWIQNKREVIDDLYNGKLTYKSINSSDEQLVMRDNTTIVRMNSTVQAEMNGKLINLKLKVLQVWILVDSYKKEEWKLFARQSVKVE